MSALRMIRRALLWAFVAARLAALVLVVAVLVTLAAGVK